MSDIPPTWPWGPATITVRVRFKCVGNPRPDVHITAVPANITLKKYKEHLKSSKSITGKIEFNGKDITDEDKLTLRKHGIRDGSELFVRSFNFRRKPTHFIKIRATDAERNCVWTGAVKVFPHTSFADLSHVMQDKIGMLVEEQTWYKEGKQISTVKFHVVEFYDKQSKDPLEVRWSPKFHATGAVHHAARDGPVIRQPSLTNLPPKELSQEELIASVPETEIININKAFLGIADEIDNWETLATEMGFQDKAISAIKYNYPSDIEEQRYQCIYMWHRYNGRQANWRALVKACCSIGNVTLAKHIRDIYKTVTSVQE